MQPLRIAVACDELRKASCGFFENIGCRRNGCSNRPRNQHFRFGGARHFGQRHHQISGDAFQVQLIDFGITVSNIPDRPGEVRYRSREDFPGHAR